MGITTLLQWKTQWPEWEECIEKREQEFARQTGTTLEVRWQSRLAGSMRKQQHALTMKVQQANVRSFQEGLNEDHKILLQGAQGSEAGAFLMLPPEATPMADTHFRTAVQLRLRCDKYVIGGPRCGEHCANKGVRSVSRSGGNAPGGQRGQPTSVHHAVTCQAGGGVVQRHNDIRDAVARWCKKARTGNTFRSGIRQKNKRSWMLSTPAARVTRFASTSV